MGIRLKRRGHIPQMHPPPWISACLCQTKFLFFLSSFHTHLGCCRNCRLQGISRQCISSRLGNSSIPEVWKLPGRVLTFFAPSLLLLLDSGRKSHAFSMENMLSIWFASPWMDMKKSYILRDLCIKNRIYRKSHI